jgi:hypothetical protein
VTNLDLFVSSEELRSILIFECHSYIISDQRGYGVVCSFNTISYELSKHLNFTSNSKEIISGTVIYKNWPTLFVYSKRRKTPKQMQRTECTVLVY